MAGVCAADWGRLKQYSHSTPQIKTIAKGIRQNLSISGLGAVTRQRSGRGPRRCSQKNRFGEGPNGRVANCREYPLRGR